MKTEMKNGSPKDEYPSLPIYPVKKDIRQNGYRFFIAQFIYHFILKHTAAILQNLNYHSMFFSLKAHIK